MLNVHMTRDNHWTVLQAARRQIANGVFLGNCWANSRKKILMKTLPNLQTSFDSTHAEYNELMNIIKELCNNSLR